MVSNFLIRAKFWLAFTNGATVKTRVASPGLVKYMQVEYNTNYVSILVHVRVDRIWEIPLLKNRTSNKMFNIILYRVKGRVPISNFPLFCSHPQNRASKSRYWAWSQSKFETNNRPTFSKSLERSSRIFSLVWQDNPKSNFLSKNRTKLVESLKTKSLNQLLPDVARP
jgi:hypothetical protein